MESMSMMPKTPRKPSTSLNMDSDSDGESIICVLDDYDQESSSETKNNSESDGESIICVRDDYEQKNSRKVLNVPSTRNKDPHFVNFEEELAKMEGIQEEIQGGQISTGGNSFGSSPSNNFGGGVNPMIDIRVDEDLDEYRNLRNADCASGRILLQIKDLNQSINAYDFSNLSSIDNCAGVFAYTYLEEPSKVKMGYIQINPKIEKCFEAYKAMNAVYTVLKGTVVFKETQSTIDNSNPYTKERILTRGTATTVPEGHRHIFENRTEDDVIIHFVFIY